MDRKNMENHIRGDDYFGTKATVLDLMRQDIKKDGYRPMHDAVLQNMRDELLYLQDHYMIVEKNRSNGKV